MGAVESVEYNLLKIFSLLFRSVGWMEFKRSSQSFSMFTEGSLGTSLNSCVFSRC